MKSNETKSLTHPEKIQVADVMIWRDGGTTSVVLEDGEQRQFFCCFDYKIGSRTQGRLYIGSLLPDEEPAHLVPLGSGVEQTILSILKRHLDEQFTETEQQKLAGLDGSRGFTNISERDHQAYLLLTRIQQLESLSHPPDT